MRTPKDCWLTSPYVSWLKTVIQDPSFDHACQYALMQLQHEMPPTTVPGHACDPYMAIDANSQMFGARRVLEILSTLSEPIKTPKPLKTEQLKYDRKIGT